MIFYFSGTNNSKHAAEIIATKNNLALISIAAEMKRKSNMFTYTLKEDEVIGFVFPVYAWAPPKIVLDFIKKSSFNGYKNNYVFSVCTCGADVGYTMDCISNQLSEKNIKLDSGFSVIMPSNYMIHDDIDPIDLQHKKLIQADVILKKINQIIGDRQTNIFDLEIGTIPFIRTKMISLLFNRFFINPKKFYAEDTCISCKRCEQVCPTDNISIHDRPKWGNHCTLCLGCINSCPVTAIQYGTSTKTKGRYCYKNAHQE